MPLHELGFVGLHIHLWTLFGRVPVALLFVWLLVAGLRRGWDWRGALLATAAFGAGLSLGTAMLPSVLGAVGGGIGAWLLAQRALGLRRPPLAALGAGLVLVVAIGRLGCLYSGCCFGGVSTLPWAVHYAHGSAPWLLHRALGLVGDATPTSLGVHPYPLYESLALVLWLPVIAWLIRRLRSEGAVLALTASYDLAVRAGIDGLRAMLNVWWAKLGAFAGLDRFQWALLLGALVMAGAALVLEQRARRVARAAPAEAAMPREPTVPPSALATWCVFVGAWLVGLVFDGAQTPFLYRVHVITLLAAVSAVRLPELHTVTLFGSNGVRAARLATTLVPRLARWLVGPALVQRRALRLAGPALALVLVALLARHVEATLARADEPGLIENTIDERGWIYEVDHRNGTLVRLGSVNEPGAALRVRHLALQLGPIPEAPNETAFGLDAEEIHKVPLRPSRGHWQHWLGLEFAGGAASYIRESSCGGGFTAFDRAGFGGWLRYDAQLPFADTWTASFGGRAGGAYASTEIRAVDSATATVTRQDDRLGFANAWAEIEEPHFAFGVALYGDFFSGLSDVEGGGRTQREELRVRVGGHLRVGFPLLSLDIGYLDRDALLGVTTLRAGFVSMLALDGDTVERLEDVRIRLGGGAMSYPASRDWILASLVGFYFLAEYLPSPGLSLGVQGAVVEGGGMFGVTLRYRVGD